MLQARQDQYKREVKKIIGGVDAKEHEIMLSRKLKMSVSHFEQWSDSYAFRVRTESEAKKAAFMERDYGDTTISNCSDSGFFIVKINF